MNEDLESLDLITWSAHRTYGSETVTFRGPVTQGHKYSINFRLKCEIDAGTGTLTGMYVGCFFDETDLIPSELLTGLAYDIAEFLAGLDPHASWSELSVSLGHNNFELLGVITQKLNEMQSHLDSLTNQLDILNGKLDGVQNNLGVMDNKFDTMDGKLDDTQTHLGVIHGQVEEMDDKLDQLKEVVKEERKN
jgi:hypothetical protein